MKDSDVVLCFKQNVNYPNKQFLFRPEEHYPEYPFEEISQEKNDVYELVRQTLCIAGLDTENFGTSNWNPLGEIIKPGQTVLLKPNMVMHKNMGGFGEECLYTNPSVVAAIIDFVYIALKGNGKIIVGDAPMQECDFQLLIKNSGYEKMIEYYLSKNICIELVDLRNIATIVENNVRKVIRENKNGVIVDLAEKSAFSNMSTKRIKNLRVTNYAPDVLQQNHNVFHHKYSIAPQALEADVIINMPKPKTHRKAGVTIAQKNFIGVNTSKDFLPHHTLGSAQSGGDAYKEANFFLALANKMLDCKNEYEKRRKYFCAKIAIWGCRLFIYVGKRIKKERFFEGSWYGNDTIWRTIKDINYVMLYADKNGNIQQEPKRKIFVVADLIIAGEGEGPLMPSPHYLNTIALGYNNLIFDKVVCSLMGINYKYIPSISAGINVKECIISNKEEWNEKRAEDLYQNSIKFIMPSGWVEYDTEGKSVKKEMKE